LNGHWIVSSQRGAQPALVPGCQSKVIGDKPTTLDAGRG
jgi:hypothetical protein